MRFKCLPSYIKTLLSLAWLMIALDKAKQAFAEEKQEENQDEKWVLRGKQYPLEVLPLIDYLDIEGAFLRRNYMKFLLKCVFFQGPCDLVGKWLKPRTLDALQGVCLHCTEHQEKNMEGWLLTLIAHNKDLFRIAMIKVCMDMKIDVSEEERNRTIPYLTRDDLRDFLNVIN